MTEVQILKKRKERKTMEKTRKILAVLTILVMALCMTTTVFAAGVGTITISNAVAGQTYNAYRIFDLESYSTETGAYSYKINDTWKAFAESADAQAYITVDDDGYVTWKEEVSTDEATAAEFAQKALAYAKANSIAPTKAETAGEGVDAVAIAELDLGYYLVDSTVGTLCELTTTATEVTITDKNDVPTIENFVKADSGAWDETNTATIGDTVEHKVEINAKEGAENYVLTIDNSVGLSNPTVTEVKLGEDTVEPSNYDVTITDNDIKIEFKKEFLDTLTDDSVIEVYHSETLNENAVIYDGTKGNTSTATLTHGEKNDITATDGAVTTYTYRFDLVKTKTDDTILKGATFKLYDAATEGDEIKVVKVSDGVYRVATEAEAAQAVVIEAGIAQISGLGNGTYYLEEVAAPEGYNKLSSRASVTIKDTLNIAITQTTESDGVNVEKYLSGGVQVENKTGTELPTTGGMGTTILYIIGGTLMVAAGVTIVARKKMSANQK